ncbi:hypothetical protein CLCR_00536 [Cladophialophora carrionii]|uniref:Uncharacterized protein n=1 Tax=Cladophialophora carrionii TaxID=86049 RepID=A0A1C1CBT0_9EURO|nr:hypothetical protein CLCR_00536 [Cladophialophora carrionii]
MTTTTAGPTVPIASSVLSVPALHKRSEVRKPTQRHHRPGEDGHAYGLRAQRSGNQHHRRFLGMGGKLNARTWKFTAE